MKISQIQKAVDWLNANPGEKLTPDGICEKLQLACTPATLGRKLRAKAKAGIVGRSYHKNPRGEEIAIYSAVENIGNGGEPIT